MSSKVAGVGLAPPCWLDQEACPRHACVTVTDVPSGDSIQARRRPRPSIWKEHDRDANYCRSWSTRSAPSTPTPDTPSLPPGGARRGGAGPVRTTSHCWRASSARSAGRWPMRLVPRWCSRSGEPAATGSGWPELSDPAGHAGGRALTPGPHPTAWPGKDRRDRRRARGRKALSLDAGALPTPRADGDREALRILLVARPEMTTEKTAKTNRLIPLLRRGDDYRTRPRPDPAGQLCPDQARPPPRAAPDTREQAVRRGARRLALVIVDLNRALGADHRPNWAPSSTSWPPA